MQLMRCEAAMAKISFKKTMVKFQQATVVRNAGEILFKPISAAERFQAMEPWWPWKDVLMLLEAKKGMEKTWKE